MNNIKVCSYFKSKFLEFKVLQLFSILILHISNNLASAIKTPESNEVLHCEQYYH